MSIRVMTSVWDNGPDKQGDLLVLLALADFADDHGNCWPSIKSIAEKARVQERSAQRIIRRLEEEGHLKVVQGGGRHGCNKYQVTTTLGHPVQVSPPDTDDKKPRPKRQETLTGGSPEPSRTIKEPSVPPKSPTAILAEVAGWQAAEEFVAHRQQIKKPLTELAAQKMANRLSQHSDPAAVLDFSIENGWQGIFPEKVNANDRASKSQQRLDAFIAGAVGAPEVDSGQGCDPSQPLLARR